MKWYGLGQTARAGLSTEVNFGLTALHYGCVGVKATSAEDMAQHIDLYMLDGGGIWRVDVKSMKRISRRGEPQDTWAWLELRGGNGGWGWLYGKAEVIAFERTDTFWLVDRYALAKHVNTIIAPDIVRSPHLAAYRTYQRQGRSDLLTLIHYEAMRPCLIDIWEKVVCLT